MSVGEITSTGKQSGSGEAKKLYEITMYGGIPNFPVSGALPARFKFLADTPITDNYQLFDYIYNNNSEHTVECNTVNLYLYTSSNNYYAVRGYRLRAVTGFPDYIRVSGEWVSITQPATYGSFNYELVKNATGNIFINREVL